MIRAIIFAVLLVVFVPVRAAAVGPAFEFDGLPVSQVLRLVYAEAYPDRAYFLDPSVLADDRPVSLRYRPTDGDFRAFLGFFLRSLGFVLEEKNKADVIRSIPPTAVLSPIEDSSQDVFYYKPKFRNGAYLVEIVSPLFKGKFTGQRSVNVAPGSNLASASRSAPPTSALGQITKSEDQLIFFGSHREVAALRKILEQVDTPPGQVVVSGALYEVQSTEREGSALQLAASILGGKLTLNLGSSTETDSFISFKSNSVQAIMQALSTDSRFKVISSPSVRVNSGARAVFNVGQDVPVLGAITYPQGGSSPVQSVDYRSSGVIFTISPEVRDTAIEVDVEQQVSTFVNTTTGVNNSPTLTKRQINTSVSMVDGDVIVIGGLREDRKSNARSGLSFLPSYFDSKTRDDANTEILLFLQIKRIEQTKT